LIGHAAVPYPSEPIFVSDQTGQIKPNIPITYYIGCAATENSIYALFAGYHEKPGVRPADCTGRFVHVFDWNGKLVRVFSLRQPVDQIAIDDVNRRIVGVCTSGASLWAFGLESSTE
jgi:hypothetical protein